ncbi:MAG: hypothetical protein ACLVI9_11765, partial [Anaerostipes hadrus]
SYTERLQLANCPQNQNLVMVNFLSTPQKINGNDQSQQLRHNNPHPNTIQSKHKRQQHNTSNLKQQSPKKSNNPRNNSIIQSRKERRSPDIKSIDQKHKCIQPKSM